MGGETKKQKQTRPVLALPIYVLIEDDALVLPAAKLEYCKVSELPATGNYYVLTREGMQISKDTTIVKALSSVKEVPVLASFGAAAKLRLPKIPPLVGARAWSFFARVYKEHKSESELMLLYNSEQRLYDLWCPQQEVSLGGVHYEMSKELAETPKEWQNVGTIHSHADFSAYHSGTDINDEKDADGVHITIGHVDEQECSLSCSVAINGNRWKLPPENILLGLSRGKGERKRYAVNINDHDEYYTFELAAEEQALLAGCKTQIEDDWLPRVEKKVHAAWSGGGIGYHTVWHRDAEPSFQEEEEDGEWRFKGGVWEFLSTDELDQEDNDKEVDDAIAEAGGETDA